MSTIKKIKKIKFSVWQLLALGYFGVILFGSALLSLPIATANGETTYLNALFVSTSATCVTGLVPYDTGTHWTLFGQIVILLLIQVGGLGFMTFVSIVVQIFGRKMSMFENKALMLSAGQDNTVGLGKIIRRIFRGTMFFEGCGAVILSIRFIRDFGFAKGVYFAVFHSVSAFCNAGFDLMGSQYGEYASMTHYSSDVLVVVTLCALIIIGGLGFCVWGDVTDNKFKWKKLRLHTKVVLLVNGLLLVASTALFWLFEKDAQLCNEMSVGQQILVAFFNATTTRTAGFNTIDFAQLSGSSYMLSIILMFVGGCSGSTAGGIKVNTCAVIIMGMLAAFRGRKDVEIGQKRISQSLVSQALAVLVSCLFLVIISTITICALEPQAPVTTVLFEAISALGTVGLSMSLTPTLQTASKIIIIALMYAGRVGILTIALAFGESRSIANVRKPVDETILIG